jgi:hypothetical protein
VCCFIVLHDLTILIIESRSATGAAFGDAVATRPVEGVYTHNSFVPDPRSAGKACCHSESVVQIGGIMAVYGLSLRQLIASQPLSADVQSPNMWAIAACESSSIKR